MSFQYQDFSREIYFIDHFIDSNGDTNWLQQASSGANGGAIGQTGHIGVTRFVLGTQVSSRFALRQGTTSLSVGTGQWTFGTSARIKDLSTPTGEYVIQFGFCDSSTVDSTDGVYFEYDRISAGDFWKTCTAAADTRTKTTTSIPVSVGDFKTFKFDIHPTGEYVNFYINNQMVATHTTNIPTGNQEFNIHLILRKYSGAFGPTGIDFDYVTARCQLISGIFP